VKTQGTLFPDDEPQEALEWSAACADLCDALDEFSEQLEKQGHD
jgi:hypothetical protein